MENYDNNKDKRLTKKEALAMAYDIANGIVDQRKIDRYWSDFGKNNEEKS